MAEHREVNEPGRKEVLDHHLHLHLGPPRGAIFLAVNLPFFSSGVSVEGDLKET